MSVRAYPRDYTRKGSPATFKRPGTQMNLGQTKIRDDLMPRARILLVDDNLEILNHVSEVLGSFHEIVGKLEDGAISVSEITRLKPDIVVLDISLGDYSGIEICRQLFEHGF